MRKYRPIKYQLRRRLEKFESRIANLPVTDRQLVKIFMTGLTFSQIGFMAGVSPATVSRRLVRIAKRLSSANYIYALGYSREFDPAQMQILRDYFVAGLSISAIADKRKRSRGYVRRVITALEKIVAKKGHKQHRPETEQL